MFNDKLIIFHIRVKRILYAYCFHENRALGKKIAIHECRFCESCKYKDFRALL